MTVGCGGTKGVMQTGMDSWLGGPAEAEPWEIGVKGKKPAHLQVDTCQPVHIIISVHLSVPVWQNHPRWVFKWLKI